MIEDPTIQPLFEYYESLLNVDIADYAKKKVRMKLPICPVSILRNIIENARVTFSRETNSEVSSFPPLQTFSNTPFTLNVVSSGNNPILKISGPIVIVGALNGHLIDLLRIIKSFGSPIRTKYLFLGNFVNNGNFSIQVSTLLFLMKILFPTNVYILRGFQEFRDTCDGGGFWNEIYKTYGHNRQLYMSFMRAFSFIPLAAIVDNSLFCISGGIGCNVVNTDLINSIYLPVNNFNDPKISDLMLSDPTDSLPLFLPRVRGEGSLFGSVAVKNFLEKVPAKVLIRTREVVDEGIQSLFDGTCISIYSSSSNKGNKVAILTVKDGNCSPTIFENLPDISNDFSQFVEIEDENEFLSFICSRGIEKAKIARMNVSNPQKQSSAPLNPLSLPKQSSMPLSPLNPPKQPHQISPSLSSNSFSKIKELKLKERKESPSLILKPTIKEIPVKKPVRSNSPVLSLRSQKVIKMGANSPTSFLTLPNS